MFEILFYDGQSNKKLILNAETPGQAVMVIWLLISRERGV